ncbi:hypothetical protein MARINOS108_20423 [Marinoscillum sp. 108]|nr:hypothetical protein MARINOS108_20423 [Marinoscillum sp. 108]
MYVFVHRRKLIGKQRLISVFNNVFFQVTDDSFGAFNQLLFSHVFHICEVLYHKTDSFIHPK